MPTPFMAQSRYARQTCLPEIGPAGQEKLGRARVLCVGAGGLGSPALLYLTAAGVGTIGIVDFDNVEASNLQRQILFQEDDVSHPKATCAQVHLSALNSNINFHAHTDKLTSENIADLFQSYDIILDGSDNFETKFLINDAAIKYKKAWIYGAIQGFDGQVSVFDFREGTAASPCYRCLFPKPPQAPIQNCAENGVLGCTAGMIGITQALQAIALIIDPPAFVPLIGKLATFHTRTMEMKQFNIQKRVGCLCCGRAENITLHDEALSCACVMDMSVQTMEGLPDAYLIDVREQDEWNSGHIKGAVHFPLSAIMAGQNLPQIPSEKTIVFYCRSGGRSLQAARVLMPLLKRPLYNLTGGYIAWQHQSSQAGKKSA